jgi:hypothetical protein
MASNNIIYSSDPGLIIGFHGCSKELRDKVVLGKTSLRHSNNAYDWLGDGIYFWQNNYQRALDYATNPPPRVQIKNPAVLGAFFSLGNCLDFTDKKSLDLLKISYDTLEKTVDAEGTELPTNSNPPGVKNSNDKILRRLDCAVIKNIHKITKYAKQPPFESVRGVFFEGNELYNGAGFLDKTHIQICIRNPNLIKGYFIPRMEKRWNG